MSVVGLFGGVLADRYDRRMLLAVTQLVSMGNIVILAVLTILGQIELWQLYASSVVFGITQSLSAPARQALISGLVPKEDMLNAVALNSILQHSSRIFWPSVAGGVIAWFGMGPALAVNAACFVVGVVPLFLMRGLSKTAGARHKSPLRELREGIGYARSAPVVSLIIGLTLSLGMFGLAFNQMAPGYAREGFGMNAAEAGLFMMCLGIGGLLTGGVLTMVKVKNHRLVFVGGTMVFAISINLMAVNPWYPLLFVLAAMNGIGNSAQSVVANTVFQVAVPTQFLGRVVSLWFLAAGLASIAALPIGIAGDVVGLRVAFAGAASIYLGIAFWFGIVRPRLARQPFG
jgi:MFS family permease